jgi:phosphate uptake regulator
MQSKEVIIEKYSEHIADHLINLAKNYSKGYINPNITDHLVVKDEVSKFLNVMVEELNG